ncbi:MAG TPA: hypothetical protein VGB55_09590 [Tepidisphaeraceae bacterium]|jgi:hypothetical protein
MSTTKVQIICPNLLCRKCLHVPIEIRGRVVKCQHCQTLLKVPDGAPPKPLKP